MDLVTVITPITNAKYQNATLNPIFLLLEKGCSFQQPNSPKPIFKPNLL